MRFGSIIAIVLNCPAAASQPLRGLYGTLVHARELPVGNNTAAQVLGEMSDLG